MDAAEPDIEARSPHARLLLFALGAGLVCAALVAVAGSVDRSARLTVFSLGVFGFTAVSLALVVGARARWSAVVGALGVPPLILLPTAAVLYWLNRDLIGTEGCEGCVEIPAIAATLWYLAHAGVTGLAAGAIWLIGGRGRG